MNRVKFNRVDEYTRELIVPKKTGDVIRRILTDAYYLMSECVKPIGYSLEGFNHNITSFGEGITSTPQDLIFKLSQCSFTESEKFPINVVKTVHLKFTTYLDIGKLRKSMSELYVTTNLSDDRILFQGKEGTTYFLRIYFNKTNVHRTSKDNLEVLEENGIDISQCGSIFSYHTPENLFNIQVEEHDYESERIVVKFSEEYAQPDQILDESVSKLLSLFVG